MQIDYSTKHAPTIAAFHRSQAFVRGLRGPIGSGKSVACCMEILAKALLQKPGPDGVRRTRWAIVRNCFDDQTEILTEKRGFQLFRNLEADDKVAMRSEEGALVFVTPSSYYAAPYKGKMQGWKGEQLDFLVTPGHKQWVRRMYSRKKVWSAPEFQFTRNIYGSHNKFRAQRNVENWTGAPVAYSEDMFEFLGYWFAEGCAGKHTSSDNVTRSHWSLTSVKDIEYVRELLARIGASYREAKRQEGGVNFYIEPQWDQSLFDALCGYGKVVTKFLPIWIKSAPRNQLQAFLRGFQIGDGSSDAAVHKSTFLYTSSRELADDLQEIAFKAGYVANLNSRDRRDGSGPGFTPTAVEHTLTLCKESKYRPLLSSSGWYEEDYDAMVYCVEVPTHVVYVRRNGVSHWSSQTYPELVSTTIKTWKDWLKPEVFGPIVYGAPITHSVQLQRDCHLEILFLALDRPKDVRKLLSLELSGVWINEAREIPKAVLDAATGRVGRFPSVKDGGCTWSGVILDTNSPDDDHWWYRLAEEEQPHDWQFFNQPSGRSDGAENLPHLPLGYYTRLMAGKDPEWVKVYVDSEYGTIIDGRPIYPEFSARIHVAEKPLQPYRGLSLHLGFDFGLTPAVIMGQITPRGQLRILQELISESMGIRQFLSTVVKPCLSNEFSGMKLQVHGDPAGVQRAQTDERTCFDELEAAGLKGQPARTNAFLPRREAVAGFLTRLTDGDPAFLLDPSCKTLTRGFNGGYRYRRIQVPGEERFADKADKNRFSHPHDGLQYLALAVEIPTTERARSRVYTPPAPAYRPASAAGY